jgi:LPS-assembly lipoprotein
MLWSKAFIVVLVASVLHGCGFRPLYGKSEINTGVTQSLSQVSVDLIEDRIGQKLRNFLLDRLNPNGEPTHPRYALKVTTTSSRTDLGIERDETATRAILILNAEYLLLDNVTEEPLLQGSLQSTNSFNIVDSDFATLSAENDAQDRAAREISNDIKTRLGLYFSRKPAQ